MMNKLFFVIYLSCCLNWEVSGSDLPGADSEKPQTPLSNEELKSANEFIIETLSQGNLTAREVQYWSKLYMQQITDAISRRD